MPTRLVELSTRVEQMNTGTIRASWPVAAAQHEAAGWTTNWLLARGNVLVADGPKVWPSWFTYVARYWVRPSALHDNLCWIITLSAASSANKRRDFSFVFNYIRDGAATPASGTFFCDGTPREYLFPDINNLGAGSHEYGFTIATDEVSPVGDEVADPTYLRVHSVQLIESPFGYLDDTTSGVEPVSRGSQILEDNTTYESLGALSYAHEQLRSTYYKRGALFTSAIGGTEGTGNTSFEALFPLVPVVQTRHMYNGETTRTVRCNVFGEVTGGAGTGVVTIDAGGGSTATFSLANGSYAWGTEQALTVRTDDPSRWVTDGGMRSGGSGLDIQYRVTDGATVLVVHSICVFDIGGD